MLRWLRNQFKPKSEYIAKLIPAATNITVPYGKTLLEAALDAGVDMPYRCTVGTCASCKCRLIQGSINTQMDLAYTLSKKEIQEGYILACQALLESDIIVNIKSSYKTKIFEHSGRVLKIERVCEDVAVIELQLDKPVFFQAGQFSNLKPEGLNESRSYSFADKCEKQGSIIVSFHVRLIAQGTFSNWLSQKDRIDSVVKLSEPQGNFHFVESDRPILCVGGGTGIAPIIAILEEALERNTKAPVLLLYGTRNKTGLYIEDRINTLAEKWNGPFSYEPVLSEEHTDTDWKGLRGQVSDKIQGKIDCFPIPKAQVYLCGPSAMIDSALPILESIGTHAENIYFDKFTESSSPGS